MGNFTFIFRVIKLSGNKTYSVEEFTHLNASDQERNEYSCSNEHDYCNWAPDNRTETIE